MAALLAAAWARAAAAAASTCSSRGQCVARADGPSRHDAQRSWRTGTGHCAIQIQRWMLRCSLLVRFALGAIACKLSVSWGAVEHRSKAFMGSTRVSWRARVCIQDGAKTHMTCVHAHLLLIAACVVPAACDVIGHLQAGHRHTDNGKWAGVCQLSMAA